LSWPSMAMILLRMEVTKDRIPAGTLDVLVAETQGSIGYIFCRALRNRIPRREVAAVLTQVVSREDPGFLKPSKPIGPFYSQEKAYELKKLFRRSLVETPERGWRWLCRHLVPRE